MFFARRTRAAEESFFGLGDKPTEFNLRGKRLKNWNTDAYSVCLEPGSALSQYPFLHQP